MQNEEIITELQTQQPQEDVPLRKSTREMRSAISDDYVVFFQEHDTNVKVVEGDPINFHQAKQNSNFRKWIDFVTDELKFMKDNDVWDLVDLAQDAKPIGCKWTFKPKRDSKGNVERYKTRLVAKDFTKKKSIDFKETSL